MPPGHRRSPSSEDSHAFDVALATVAFQAVISLTLLNWQLGKRLRFEDDQGS